MPSPAGPIVGTIAIEPLKSRDASWSTDDSSLAALLASLAQCQSLNDDRGGSLAVERIVTSTRWSRQAMTEESPLKADLARLMAELDTEYDALLRQT